MEYSENYFHQSTVGTEPAIHQLSPYIGKIKSSIATHLVENYSKRGQTVLDPFSGAGTIPFEAWRMGRNVIANDLNRYAITLTRAKLNPVSSEAEAIGKLKAIHPRVISIKESFSGQNVPEWVKTFFHPETLAELVSWAEVLKKRKEAYVLSCLLGILHHQRPGFLSFPSSHTVPYLRSKKYPISEFPEMYEYRNVGERLERKLLRSLKRLPRLDRTLSRECWQVDAATLQFDKEIDVVITSPPYMRNLHYARDNRLRLWLLGEKNIEKLEDAISPKEKLFLELSDACFSNWHGSLKRGGHCILFVGDNRLRNSRQTLPDRLIEMATAKGFKLVDKYDTSIPTNRRVRRTYAGNRTESVVVLKKKG